MVSRLTAFSLIILYCVNIIFNEKVGVISTITLVKKLPS